MPETGAEILARIKPRLPEDWTEICLRPDLQAEYEELDSELRDLQTSPGPERLAGGIATGAQVLAERVEAIRQQIAESAVRFVFRGLSRDDFRLLCDEHPPRPGDIIDMQIGYDRQGVTDALVRASLVAPVFDDAAWADLTAVISPGEWAEMLRVAEKVNGSVVTDAPKAGLASRILLSLASASEPQPEQE